MTRCLTIHCCVLLLSILKGGLLVGQTFKVLHYTETSGFDHQTRSASFAMFKQMGQLLNFTLDHDSTGQTLDDPLHLNQYKVVIFSNTTGDAILNQTQRQNFENYMNTGGRFMGIHSASDTYRHSSSNGNNTGGWDWYAIMLGASVQENPHHVNGTPVYKIHKQVDHDILKGIPDHWSKAEEYYYWKDGYFNQANNIIQKVEQTVGPNGLVNSYDSARAVTWYKLTPAGGKTFYTSLGHSITNFTSEVDFINLMKNAMLWITDQPVGVLIQESTRRLSIAPNPATNVISINDLPGKITISIYDSYGKLIEFLMIDEERATIDVEKYPSGLYLVLAQNNGYTFSGKFLKE